jgi:hypothetical protein
MAEYLHPSVTSRIIDNSQVFVTAVGLTLLYAAFPAESGPDNRIQLVTTDSEFLFYYGAPNMRKYGQTAYNVVRWLRAGGAALCLRVLPYIEKDANDAPLQQSTYAAYILEVGCKVDTANGKQVKVRTRTLGDGRGALPAATEKAIRTDASLQGLVLAQPDDPEADGFMYHPLAVIRGKDRGVKYNAFGLSIDLNDRLDETYAHRVYDMAFYASASDQRETFLVSFYPEATNNSGASQFFVDVLKNFSNYGRGLFSEDGYDAITEYINDDATVAKKIDMFTLQERSVSVPETIHAGVTVASGSADLTPTPEVFRPMGGGSDGDWVGPNSLEALLYKAYSGSGDFIDPSSGANIYDTLFSDAWDKKAYPFDMMLDANYPMSVKVAMSNFASARGDFMSILDVGFTGSPGQAIKIRQNQLSINSFYSAIFVQDFVVEDEFQGNDIQVTPTYFLAEKIPSNDAAFGIHWPFVGPRRGAVAGFKSMSWAPNDVYREELYKAKLNYVERDVRQTKFNSQSTSQFVNSALSDISHVRTLLRIRRELENIGETYEFEFNDGQTWDSLQYSVNSYLQTWVSNRALDSASGTVYASAYDRQQRIVRIKAEVVFNGLIERVMIDIVVDK